MRKIWSWFWSPHPRYSLAVLSMVGFFGGIVAWGGFNTFMEYTNTMDFCISCHEMRDNVYKEYLEKPHYKNPAGVRATCSDCHVPKDWAHKLIRKVKATQELYHAFLGTIDTPEKFEAHRLTMAKRVWAEMKENDSKECRNCHSYEAMHFEKQKPESAKQMKKGMEDGETCIDCHKGIAHKLPDMSQGYKKMYEDLVAESKAEGAKADILYNLTTKDVYLDPDAAKAGKSRAGRLLPATEVSVLERKGDLLKVRVDGWQQEGAERLLYVMMRHRIFAVALGKQAVENVVQHERKVDPDTELVWFRASVEVWMTKEYMLADADKLWAYAAEMNNANCGVCHSLRTPDHYLANQWIGVMRAMERFITLDKDSYRFLLKYLQLNARDTGGSHH